MGGDEHGHALLDKSIYMGQEIAPGDRIEPGMKVIAVSPDLVRKGLKRGTKVRIDELEGEWIVLDRTPSRLRNHIDLYMGTDVAAAREWGRKKVTIRW
jgi:3D (Asp-Asp-Asp) domain-containing protein